MRLTILYWMVLLALAPILNAQPAAAAPAGPVRQMSLNDCIRMALERNLSIMVGDSVTLGDTADLDVQTFGKLGLQQSHLALESSYGYYDPVLSMGGGQSQETMFTYLGGLGSINDASLGGKTELRTDTFGLELSGVAPTGTRYEISAGMNRLNDGFNEPGIPGSYYYQYNSTARITITQPLLRDFWIDRDRLNIRLAKVNLKRSELEFRLLVMDVVQRVAAYYFDFLANRDEIKVQEKALELANQLVAENKTKVAAGTIAPLEARQSESQAATAKAALTAAIFAAQQADNLLKALITHEFNTIQPVNIEPTEKLIAVYQAPSLAESWRSGLEQRPDYLIAKTELESRDIALVYRKNQLYPALDLEATYGRNGFGNSTSDSLGDLDNNSRYPTYGGFVTLTVPLWRKSERANYKSAKVARQSAILSLKRKEDSVLQEIDIAVKEVISRYQAIESTRQARLFAEEALQAEQNKLENGKSTTYDVLLTQRDLTAASSAEIKALADYNKALHLFYFREGTTLERNKINLELR
jgi:outer membrane protein TolC